MSDDRLIPEGVEVKDTQDREINEFRLRRLLAAEERFEEERATRRPIIDQAARWGFVQEVHTIGDIQIAEVKWCIDGQTRYLIFVDGKDTHRAEESLDAALIYALCYKHDGYNTRAPEYIYRMIGLKEGDNRV